MKEEIKTDAICLRSVEYGESDRIITLLTDKLGKIAVRARGVSSPKSRLRHAAVPFSFGEYILVENGDFYSLKSFDYNDAFTSVSDDLVRYFSSAAALEVADKLTEENVSVSEELARLLRFLMTVCYDGGSLPEVLGGAAEIVRGFDADEWAAAALRLLREDPAARAERATAGRAHAASFTWERCARETLAVYRALA